MRDPTWATTSSGNIAIRTDLDDARVTVRRQLAITDYVLRLDAPKSDKGRRSIDIDPTTVEILREGAEVSVASPVGFELAGWNGEAFVFTRSDGSPHHPESVSAAFDQQVTDLDVPRIRFHDLRHTHVAHLIEAGVDPLTISRRLGHASVAFTLDRYGHVFDHSGSRAAEAAAGLLD